MPFIKETEIPQRGLPKKAEDGLKSLFVAITQRPLLREVALSFQKMENSIWFEPSTSVNWKVPVDRSYGFRVLTEVGLRGFLKDSPELSTLTGELGYLVVCDNKGWNVELALKLPAWKGDNITQEEIAAKICGGLNEYLGRVDGFIKPENLKMFDFSQRINYTTFFCYLIFPNSSLFSEVFKKLKLNF